MYVLNFYNKERNPDQINSRNHVLSQEARIPFKKGAIKNTDIFIIIVVLPLQTKTKTTTNYVPVRTHCLDYGEAIKE